MPTKPSLSRFEVADLEHSNRSKPFVCSVCTWLRTLEDPADLAGLQRLFALPVNKKGHAYLAWLIEKEDGQQLSRKAIANHRQYHLGL